MKVAYILDWFLFYVTELCNAMAQEHDVLLVHREHTVEISSADDPMSMAEYLGAAVSTKVRREPMRFRRSDPRSLLEVLRIHRQLAKWGAEVLHVQETSDWRIVLLCLLNRRRTTVVTLHDVESHPGDSRGFQGFMFRLLVRSAAKIVVHGDALRRQLLQTFPDRSGRAQVETIPHGVFSLYKAWDDPTIPEEPSTVLFFGRISQYKGIDDLIAAQRIVKQSVPDARFVIAGRGQDFAPYRAMMGDPSEFEIHNRFISNREVAQFFRRAAVVVLPYREASQSGVIPIAYAFGKPVVATRVGSLPEVVEHGESGLVVDPAQPERLASAIVSILKDPQLRRKLGEGARRIGETKLAWANIAEQTARFYTRGEGP